MIRKKLMKAGIPLLLAVSLLLGPASAASADNTAQSQGITAAEEQKADHSSGAADSDNLQAEEKSALSEAADQASAPDSGNAMDSADEKKEGSKDAVDHKLSSSEDTDKSAADKEEASHEKSEDSREEMRAESDAGSGEDMSGDDDEESKETAADSIPYEELLAQENLIIVTLDQNGTGEGSEMAVETVEDLSEPQLQALEEYIEDRGYEVTTEALLADAPDSQVKTITFNMNGFISLAAEGFGSGYDAMFYVDSGDYQGNGNAYCINPAKQAPGSGSQGQKISYTTTVTNYHDPMLLKIMYYGFGGPGDLTGSFASTPTARHILTHMAAARRAAELGIPGAGDYTYGANSTAVSLTDSLYAEILKKEEIRGAVSILTPVEGQQTIMLLASWSPIPKKTKISLKKSSSDADLSEGNSLYSLEGAVYGVFSDAGLKEQVGTLTTKKDGTTESLTLDAGTYYVKEQTAPKGFLLDETVYQITGSAGESTVISAKDRPAADPVKLLLQKVDASTGKAGERLKGAEFTVSYFAAETEESLDQPDRTWIFATDEKGEILLQESYLVEGDELYKDEDGAVVLPLGFITIQETKAPEGYLINETMYTCSIAQDQKGIPETENLPTGEAAVKERPILTELSVKKEVTGSGGNKNQEFHFTLQLKSDNGIQVPETVSCLLTKNSGEEEEQTMQASIDEKGNTALYSFTLQHGQVLTFRDLPAGLEYQVKELDGESLGYQTEAENAEGTLTKDAAVVTFLNSKELVVPTGAETNTHTTTGLLLLSVLAVLGWICAKRTGIGR
ncbi:MAG: SpaA isopeptide-forming pilin-related protein [Lachnospiraceae bacterium]|nr:SpaA isopeptide-forming pilin-related protein [Lachnospiraceae bacterium]